MGKLRKVLIPVALLAAVSLVNGMFYIPFPAKGKKDKRRILCIGDSITFGAGVIYTRWRDSYPAILNRLLGDEYQVLNYGISGATAQEGTNQPYSARFRTAAAKTEPQICFFMLGTNDSKPYNWDAKRYEKAVETWMDELKAYSSDPRVVLVIPPAVFSVDGKPIVYDIRDREIREEIRPILQRIAEKKKVELLDLYEASKDHPEWFGDGVHPNAQGNQALAEEFQKVVESPQMG